MAVQQLPPVPVLGQGEDVTVEWAVVFAASEERLLRNIERAVETWEGVEEGGVRHRWIVPARKAARVSAEARLSPLWVQEKRVPAVSVDIPFASGEEIEWIKVAGEQPDTWEQVESRVVAAIGPETLDRMAPFRVEGQLSDGTIFTADIERDEIAAFLGDDSVSPDKLPEEGLNLFPNPFVTSVNISLDVHEAPRTFEQAQPSNESGISSVRIYDVKGRLVRTILEEEFLHPGEYSMGWDGNDENGMKVSPGVYYCKLQIGDRSVTKRVILLR
jgi:hypothetical protein